jgi:serine protease Do
MAKTERPTAHIQAKELRIMGRHNRQIYSLSMFFILCLSIFIFECKFSFADDSKRPSRGDITFGAEKKPEIHTSPQFESFKTLFGDIAEKVIPTVVSVIPTKIDTVVFYKNPFYNFFGDQGSPFDFFFGEPRREREQPRPEKREYRQQGFGSGVIVSNDGYILTNFHVVDGADEIEVKLSDGRNYSCTIVGSDSLSDVAVIKIDEEDDDLPVAYLGDSDTLRPGDWVMAIGNPFTLTSTVTLGIVSALGRKMDTRNDMYQNFIQTDAAINPGNSGGALVNAGGELIGINTMIYTKSGGYMGIGFAIPINMAKRIMEDLIYSGKVSRGWLGVVIQDINQATREAMNLESNKGVLISDVMKGQPADKAGIKRGDIVVAIGGKTVDNANELRNRVATIRPGKKVPVDIIRDGKKITLQVVLAERDKNVAAGKEEDDGAGGGDSEKSAESKKLGFTVAPLTETQRKEHDLNAQSGGVIIVSLDKNSIAAQQGLQEGDVILEVNRNPIRSVKDFTRNVKKLNAGESVLLLIKRDTTTFFVAFKLKE